ncbi:hypothetical protein U0070_009542, partial [Myodes glareolus]
SNGALGLARLLLWADVPPSGCFGRLRPGCRSDGGFDRCAAATVPSGGTRALGVRAGRDPGLQEDLIKYLDPEYIDRIAMPDASKLQFILAEEQFILSQVALLEQVDALMPMLDSASIKAVPEHAARLQRLAQIHIQQQDQCVDITEESKALLEEYNKTTMLLSKQFVQWDELLCQLEAAKQVKPAEE